MRQISEVQLVSEFDELMNKVHKDSRIPAIQIAVGHKGENIFSGAYGSIIETGKKIDINTRFDVASLTKIFSGICFMKLVEEGRIGIDDPVAATFPEMLGQKPIEKNGQITGYCDGGKVTWRNVLNHTTGMGWVREKTRPSLPGIDKGLDVIFDLPFAYNTGEHIVYSDIPFILLGKAIEKLTGVELGEYINKIIIKPLKLSKTGFIRIDDSMHLDDYHSDNIAPTEFDDEFRNCRVWGCVHDENSYLMGGIAAHAGIFSTAEDMCKLAMGYQNYSILGKDTVRKMIYQQAEEDGDRRGLMWQLSGRGEIAYTRCLSDNAYGHGGFTGCFLWNDPERDLSVVLLSNDVYNGRENRSLPLYRKEIMELIVRYFPKGDLV